MGQWSRAEIESAFADYQRKAADAGRSGDWTEWAGQFTEDATYIEHHYRQVRGAGGHLPSGSAPAWPTIRAGTCPNSPSSGT